MFHIALGNITVESEGPKDNFFMYPILQTRRTSCHQWDAMEGYCDTKKFRSCSTSELCAIGGGGRWWQWSHTWKCPRFKSNSSSTFYFWWMEWNSNWFTKNWPRSECQAHHGLFCTRFKQEKHHNAYLSMKPSTRDAQPCCSRHEWWWNTTKMEKMSCLWPSWALAPTKFHGKI